MLRFEKYNKALLPEVLAVFRSNVPEYFFDFEEKDLVADLPDFEDTYYLMQLDGKIIGCGGYALNPDNTVSLCWGMVHNHYLKLNYGKALLEFRLSEIEKQFPGKDIVQNTSQHTAGFYAKYGFETTHIKKDAIGPGLDDHKMILKRT